MANHKETISVGILLIFYLIGIGGVVFGDAESFLSLTPLNLLLTLGIIFWNHADWKGWWIFLLTYVGGLVIEIIGVNTGWPFGIYHYGNVLGPKIFDTPWIIGVNWLMLLYATNSIANRIGTTVLIRVAISAALMTILDILIEPVAIQMDFWTWENPTVPLSNYLSWFVLSALLSFPWQYSRLNLNKSIGFAVFLVQIIFFGALTILA
ncbi:MAG: hypothetical protein Salg2KO_09340 [Salibacteraceae bacterium]